MKKLFFTLSCIFLFPLFVYAQDLVADSKINQVTVYTQGALVSRSASFNLSQGTQKIIFPNIVPQIDENSLRVSGEGSAEVKILSASFKKEFLKESSADKVRQLQDEIQLISDDVKRMNNVKLVLLDKKEF